MPRRIDTYYPDLSLLSEVTVYNEVTLDRLPVRSARAVSREAQYAMDHAEWSRYEDHLRDQMVHELRSHVLGHKTAVQKRTGTASGSKEIQVARFPSWLFVAALVALMILSAITLSMVGWLMAMALAGMGVWALAYRQPQTERLELTVTATVDDTVYATFPDASIRYPRELGHPVITCMTGEIAVEAIQK